MTSITVEIPDELAEHNRRIEALHQKLRDEAANASDAERDEIRQQLAELSHAARPHNEEARRRFEHALFGREQTGS